jgi:hypothetical protein
MASIGPWDLLLIAIVSLQCTLIAYLHAPRAKALVLTLPIPFTLATLALGEPVNVTHAAGLVLFLGYANVVRWLHLRWRAPIVAAIATAALGYAAAGAGLARVLPRTAGAFWAAVGLLVGVGVVLMAVMAPRAEPGHRSPLPLAVKLPVLVAVIAAIVLAKQALHGFMATFPMVGVVTAYEARHSLWTVCRQLPPFLVGFAALVVAVRLTQGALGLGGGLAVGWALFLATYLPLTRRRWRTDDAADGPRMPP